MGQDEIKPWETPGRLMHYLSDAGATMSVEIFRDIIPPFEDTRLLRISGCPGLASGIRKALDYWKHDIIAALSERNVPDKRWPSSWYNPDERRGGILDIPIDSAAEEPTMFRFVPPNKLEPV